MIWERIERLFGRRRTLAPNTCDIDVDFILCFRRDDRNVQFRIVTSLAKPVFIEGFERRLLQFCDIIDSNERVRECASIAHSIGWPSTMLGEPFHRLVVHQKGTNGYNKLSIEFFALPNFTWPGRSIVIDVENDVASLAEVNISLGAKGLEQSPMEAGQFTFLYPDIKLNDVEDYRNATLDTIKTRQGWLGIDIDDEYINYDRQ